ncbi:uncharacterized protein LOC128311887 [Acinonyx jubatus]|uniref:Uncharacterized protein LOC128311887 n=1 Tax=Acinonyx jubatus TaxID=32536 RepID=A0ABM3NJZ8_ACIJB|nr:uncharacterized protein LOC128311887 [Acinonyx jubatus]
MVDPILKDKEGRVIKTMWYHNDIDGIADRPKKNEHIAAWLKDLYKSVHGSVMPKSQNMEASIDKGMDKHIVIYSCSKIFKSQNAQCERELDNDTYNVSLPCASVSSRLSSKRSRALLRSLKCDGSGNVLVLSLNPKHIPACLVCLDYQFHENTDQLVEVGEKHVELAELALQNCRDYDQVQAIHLPQSAHRCRTPHYPGPALAGGSSGQQGTLRPLPEDPGRPKRQRVGSRYRVDRSRDGGSCGWRQQRPGSVALGSSGLRDAETFRRSASVPPPLLPPRGARRDRGQGGGGGPRAPPSPTRASRGGESRPGAEPLSPADPTEARAAARRTGIRDALPPPQLRRAPGHKFAPRWPSCEWGASPGSGVSVRLLARAGPGMAGPGASPHVWGWLLLGGCLLVGAQVILFSKQHIDCDAEHNIYCECPQVLTIPEPLSSCAMETLKEWCLEEMRQQVQKPKHVQCLCSMGSCFI